MKAKVIFTKADSLVRQGQLREASKLLLSSDFAKLSREERFTAANLARRTTNYTLGLRLLAPSIFPEQAKKKPQENEVAEYAILLNANGNTAESLRLLNAFPEMKLPETLLAKAWSHFERWEYRESIPLLKRYIKTQKDPYYNLVGQVNLAEALFASENSAGCLQLTKSVIKDLSNSSNHRLLANALHIRAQQWHALGELNKSDRDLEKAYELFGDTNAPDSFLISRQKAINLATRKRSIQPIESFEKTARTTGNWKSRRELSFQSLKIRFNQKIFDQMYYGIPFPAYRDRLRHNFPEARHSSSFLWGSAGSLCVDLESGQVQGRRLIRITKQNLMLLDLLVRDLYAPLSVGAIFAGLYPLEHYDWRSSPNRVYQSLKRLRTCLSEHKIPLEILAEGGAYSLHAKDVSIRIPIQLRLSEGRETPLDCLMGHFPALKYFSAKEARNALALPKTSVGRILKDAIYSGALEQSGIGKRTRYRLTAKP